MPAVPLPPPSPPSALRSLAPCLLAALLAAGGAAPAGAQGSGVYGQGIRVNLDSAGRKYARFILWNQTWLRYEQFNPNTRVNGEAADDNVDIGIRRARIIAYGQLSPASLVFFHLGINNQTFNNGGAPNEPTGPGKKPQIFFHEIWGEHRVVPNKLYVGAGLSYWNGISRQTNASTLNFLGLDAPIFNWPNIDASDQFGRNPAIYAKGKLAKLDWRVAYTQPFVPGAAFTTLPTTGTGAAPQRVANQAVYSSTTRTKATQGYLMWQFLEQEPNTLPFTVGSYLATKRVLNLGAGWYAQPAAMRSYTGRPGADSVRHHAQTLLALDVFADLPFGAGKGGDRQAVTVYGVLYDYDFGPNFVRNVGIMNEGTPGPTPFGQAPVFNGGGNAWPQIGTGRLAHLETAWLLPKRLVRVGRVQPYAQFTHSTFERLSDPVVVPEAGVNWHLEGHHSKLTLHWRSRPIFRTVAPTGGPDGLSRVEASGRRGEVIAQSMVYF